MTNLISAEKEVERLFREIIQTVAPQWSDRVYSIGGFVRDELLQIPSKDLDILVIGVGASDEFANLLLKILGPTISHPFKLGKQFTIIHFVFREDTHFNQKTFKTSGAELDLSEALSLETDIKRRDFTVNMLARNLSNDLVVDQTGQGQQDLKTGILRGHPQKPIQETFHDDPIRIIRMVRFHLKYGWAIHADTQKAAILVAPELKFVSKERIKAELEKLIALAKFPEALHLFQEFGILDQIFTIEIKNKTIDQLANVKPDIILQMAMIFSNESPSSIEKELRGLTFSNDVLKTVINITTALSSFSKLEDSREKNIRGFIRKNKNEIEEITHLLSITQNQKLDQLITTLRNAKKIPIEKFPLIDGNEIIQILNICEGPSVQMAINLLHEISDEYAENGFTINIEQSKNELIKRFK